MKSLSSFALASLAVLAVTACGGGKDNPPLIDAPPVNMIDAPPPCSVPAQLATTTGIVAGYRPDRDTMTTGNQEYWIAEAELDANPTQDLVDIELYEGAPPGFTTLNFPATPFTINITGNETNYFTCSMCVSIFGDVDTTAAEFTYLDDYVASGGSVTITELTPTKITGTLNNVTLREVDFAEGMHTDSASGCTTTLNLPFTSDVEALPNAFAPSGVEHRKTRRAPR